jgi:flagellar biosynthetic protein FlhB
MAEESFQEKTEPATPKKREDARKKGTVAKSMELNSAAALMGGMLLLVLTGNAMLANLMEITRGSLGGAFSVTLNRSSVHALAADTMVFLALTAGPVAVGLLMIGLASNLGQVGFTLTAEALQPKFSRLNPINGVKKLLGSRRSWVELLKNLLKIVVIGIAAWMVLQDVLLGTLQLMDSDVEAITGFLAEAGIAVGLKTGIAFAVLAVLDLLFQRFEYERDLRMTKQEIKDETKHLEGDPQIKSRIRSVQRRIAYRRMMQDVPRADVVVTNPQHIAVALKYDPLAMGAPRVLAKGADLVAERIKEIAREHEIPIVEDKPLARAIFRSVEIGGEIPEKLFQAVAQLLAYIYRLRQKGEPVGVS